MLKRLSLNHTITIKLKRHHVTCTYAETDTICEIHTTVIDAGCTAHLS